VSAFAAPSVAPGDGRSNVRATAARNLLITATLADVVRRLGSAGIRALPLKGGALLAAGIVAPDQRHLDDLDLWIEPGRARDAWELLIGAGYRATPLSATHAGTSSLEAPTHQLPILRSPFWAIVELHLESHGRADSADFDVVHAAGSDAVVRALGEGVVVRVPAPRHLLEQLCGHVVLHHAGELKQWPRHVSDVRALVDREPSLAALRSRPDEVGLSLRVARGEGSDALLARLFLSPSERTQQAFRVAAVAARTARFLTDDPRGFGRVLLPTVAHLRFTGDLGDGDGAFDVVIAWLQRARRVLRRL
jgi:hypothetical protein